MVKTRPVYRLTESAILIALAAVLSLIKLAQLPYGGSITMASMFPLVILAYRHGTPWGIFCGLVYGVIQLFFGLHNFSYVPQNFLYFALLGLTDYLLAFAVLGLGGVFAKPCKQPVALVLGVILVSLLRYVCHTVSGFTVWAELHLSAAGILYSMSYNATYMLPEALILIIVAFYIGNAIDFREQKLKVLPQLGRSKASQVLGLVAGLPLAAALIFDVVVIFSSLQNADSGEFALFQLGTVKWVLVLVVTGVALVASLVLFLLWLILGKRKREEADAPKD